MKKIVATIFLFLTILAPTSLVYAANPFGKATQYLDTSVKGTGLEGTTVQSSVGTVIKGVLGLVGTIFFGLTIYAGILWMTAAGNEEQVTKATDIIKAAVIGLFITMSAYAITSFVAGKLGGVTDQASGGSSTATTGTACSDFTGSKCVTNDSAGQSSCNGTLQSAKTGCASNEICCLP